MSSPDRAVEKPEKEKNSMTEEKLEKQEPVSSDSAAVPEASSTELPAEQDEEDDYLEAVCCRRPHRQWNTDACRMMDMPTLLSAAARNRMFR